MSLAADLPLRPLLYAAGAAAAAAGGFYYIQKRRDGERRAEHADTSLPQVPVQTACADCALVESGSMSDVDGVSVTQTDGDVPESDMMAQMNTLRGLVQQLEEELSETRRICEEIRSEMEREQEAHSILKSEYNEMRETLKQCDELLKVCEREREAHSILKAQYDCMLDKEKSLKVSLAETERKYEQAMESNAELENDNSDLMSQMNILQGSVQRLEEELSETTRRHNEMIKDYEISQSVHQYMYSEYNSMEIILNQKIDLLKATVAEAEMKYEQEVESNDQLQNRNFELMADVNTLRQSVLQLEQQQAAARRTFCEITKDNERKTMELSRMQSRHNEMQEIVFKDYEEVCQAHSMLISQYNEIKEQHDKLLKESEREREAHSILRLQYDQTKETLSDNEKSLMVTLAEAVAAYEQAMESNTQLVNEKSDLMHHVHKLRGTVRQLEEMLYEADVMCGLIKQDRERAWEAYSILKSRCEETLKQHDELLMESEQEREAHSILKMQYDEMKESLKQCDELLNVSFSSH